MKNKVDIQKIKSTKPKVGSLKGLIKLVNNLQNWYKNKIWKPNDQYK